MRLLAQTPRPAEIFLLAALAALAALAGAACRDQPPADRLRVSGQVEATDVQVSSAVAGRILAIDTAEGQRVSLGATIVRLDTADAELALARLHAERAQAEAQLRLVMAGARPEDIRQAEATVASAAADVAAASADLAAADADVARFQSLVDANSGSRKQRDDAVTRRDVARERVQAARERVRGAQEAVARLKAGSRREEIEVARARLPAVDAQIAVAQKAIADATIAAPASGVVTEVIADVGEHVAPRTPLLVITDLDHAWANVYVAEPSVPLLRVGQAVTLFTDAGGEGIPGQISQIADKAEFTPRNVQTAEDRSKLVYRVKIAVDNRAGVLKSGMPVEAEIPLAR
jgi:HlyD family secretion protein